MHEESSNERGAHKSMIAGIEGQGEAGAEAVSTDKMTPTMINDDVEHAPFVPSDEVLENSQTVNSSIYDPASTSSGAPNTIVKHIPASQPTPEILAQYGVKVRDFAYESTLPPIAPIPRVPRQIQPGPRPLKRARNIYDEDDQDNQSSSIVAVGHVALLRSLNRGESDHETKKLRFIRRKSTEPIEKTRALPCRTLGYADLSLYNSERPGPSRMATAVPRTPTSIIQKRNINPFAHTFHTESQESEPFVDTPHVTPNGSLQWVIRDTSSIPASQLDTSSQEPVPEAVTYSQSGLSPEFSQGDTSPITPIIPPSHTANSVPSFLSSREAPDSYSDSPTPASSDLHPVSSKRTKARRNADMISPDPPSPRYFLRRRSLLSVHTPPRLRSHPYAVKVSPPKKSAKASPRPRRIRNDSRNGFQESLPSR